MCHRGHLGGTHHQHATQRGGRPVRHPGQHGRAAQHRTGHDGRGHHQHGRTSGNRASRGYVHGDHGSYGTSQHSHLGAHDIGHRDAMPIGHGDGQRSGGRGQCVV